MSAETRSCACAASARKTDPPRPPADGRAGTHHPPRISSSTRCTSWRHFVNALRDVHTPARTRAMHTHVTWQGCFLGRVCEPHSQRALLSSWGRRRASRARSATTRCCWRTTHRAHTARRAHGGAHGCVVARASTAAEKNARRQRAALFNAASRPARCQARAAIEAIDYLPPDSEAYRRWAGGQVAGRVWDRWVMFLCIGLAVGLAGFAAHLLIDGFAFVKARTRARGRPATPGAVRALLWLRQALVAATEPAHWRSPARPAHAASLACCRNARRCPPCARCCATSSWASPGCSTPRSQLRSWRRLRRRCCAGRPQLPARACLR
jgi:hypothetical protein